MLLSSKLLREMGERFIALAHSKRASSSERLFRQLVAQNGAPLVWRRRQAKRESRRRRRRWRASPSSARMSDDARGLICAARALPNVANARRQPLEFDTAAAAACSRARVRYSRRSYAAAGRRLCLVASLCVFVFSPTHGRAANDATLRSIESASLSMDDDDDNGDDDDDNGDDDDDNDGNGGEGGGGGGGSDGDSNGARRRRQQRRAASMVKRTHVPNAGDNFKPSSSSSSSTLGSFSRSEIFRFCASFIPVLQRALRHSRARDRRSTTLARARVQSLVVCKLPSVSETRALSATTRKSEGVRDGAASRRKPRDEASGGKAKTRLLVCSHARVQTLLSG